MSRTNSLVMLFALVCALVSGRAEAVQRAHVATYGSDSNTSFGCSVANPCRYFQLATSVVDPNGEVVVLDSGAYGAVTLTQSISLIAPTGVYAGISVFSGAYGVTIATAGVKVVLRGITINGQGGTNGIVMTAGDSLTVENCVIANLPQSAIYVNTNAAAKVQVSDTTIRGNGWGLFIANGVRATVTRATISQSVNEGVLVQGSVASTTTTADIADSTIDGGASTGVYAHSTHATADVSVSLHDSRVVRNNGFAINAVSTAGADVWLSASNNIVSNNYAGIRASGTGSKVSAGGNTVSNNRGFLVGFGFMNQSGGLFESAGNNVVRNNSAPTLGTITPAATM